MFKNIELTREIFSASWKLLMQNKGLMLYQFISGMLSSLVAVVAIYASGFVQMLLEEGFEVARIQFTATLEENWVILLIVLFLIGIVTYTIRYFFNVALVEELLKSIEGQKVSITRGLSSALGKFGKIFKFAFGMAGVAVMVSLVQSKKGAYRLVGEALELGWNLATYFVVPILVIDELGPIDAVVKSFKLITRTWGKQIMANFAIGAIFFIPGAIILAVLVGLGVLIAAQINLAVALVVTVPLVVILFIIIDLFQSSISQIFTVVLYKYVTKGEAVGGFNRETLGKAFVAKVK